MSLYQGIKHNKEYRKEYRGAKAIACSCRNHGSCDWCKANRTKDTIMNDIKYKQEIKEYGNNQGEC